MCLTLFISLFAEELWTNLMVEFFWATLCTAITRATVKYGTCNWHMTGLCILAVLRISVFISLCARLHKCLLILHSLYFEQTFNFNEIYRIGNITTACCVNTRPDHQIPSSGRQYPQKSTILSNHRLAGLPQGLLPSTIPSNTVLINTDQSAVVNSANMTEEIEFSYQVHHCAVYIVTAWQTYVYATPPKL